MSVGPFYDDGQVTLYCADMRGVGLDGQAACVVTSPPYNVGMAYDGYRDVLGWDEYRALASGAAEAICRALVPCGRAWVNTAVSVPERAGGRGRKRRVLLGLLWAQALDTAGLELVDQVAWQSVRAGGTAWGSWQSPAAPNLRSDYEVLTAACRGRWERQPPAGVEGWRDTVGHWPELCSTVWPIQTVGGRNPPGSNTPGGSVAHPAPMPAPVPRWSRRVTWGGGPSGSRSASATASLPCNGWHKAPWTSREPPSGTVGAGSDGPTDQDERVCTGAVLA